MVINDMENNNMIGNMIDGSIVINGKRNTIVYHEGKFPWDEVEKAFKKVENDSSIDDPEIRDAFAGALKIIAEYKTNRTPDREQTALEKLKRYLKKNAWPFMQKSLESILGTTVSNVITKMITG